MNKNMAFFNRLNLSVAFLTIFVLFGCGGGGGSSSQTAVPPVVVAPVPIVYKEQSDCTGTSIGDKKLAFGEYALSNNMWGAASLPPTIKFTECVYGTQLTTNSMKARFEWSLPKMDHVNVLINVKSYPEIFYGVPYPHGGKSTTTVLPLQVSAIGTLVVDYDVTINSDDVDATFFDLSYTNALPVSLKTAQVDIAVYVKRSKLPFDDWMPKIETVTIDGHDYDVYWASSPVSVKGTVSFHIKDDALKSTFKVKSFTDYLVAKGYMNSSAYLSTIEFGTEVFSGTGVTTVNNYSIHN